MKLLRESPGDVKLAKFIVFLSDSDLGYRNNYYPELPGFLFAESYIWNYKIGSDFESLEHRHLKVPYELLQLSIQNKERREDGAVEFDPKTRKKSIYYHGYRSILTPEQKEFIKGKLEKLVGKIEE